MRTGVYSLCIMAVIIVLLTAPAMAVPDVKVTVRHFRQIQNPDPGTGTDGDYYAKVRIGGGDWQTSSTVSDSTDITPGWEFRREVAGRYIPVTIQMWDGDPAGNPEDIIDLNPLDNVQELEVTLDTMTNQWSYPSYHGGVQGDGDHEHYAELEGGEAGWILFEITTCYNAKCDLDDDGIPDGIEIQGARDLDGNLVWNMNMPYLAADPCRKTIAVSVDFMEGAADGHTHQPMGAALLEADEMFENAPVPALSDAECPYANFPREPAGINFIVDEDLADNIPEQQVFTCGDFNEAFKNTHFAHREELGKYFHYSLWVHDHAAGSSSSGVACGGGRGDYLVSLGSWANQNGNQRDQAGTFAHELGHTLGLGHGGGDGINRKPNYLSIMSYQWQVVGLTDSATGASRLDFSHSALPTLDEESLNEVNGIGDGTILTAWRDPNWARRAGTGNGPLDWTWDDRDGNGDPDDDSAVVVDINGDRVCLGRGSDGVLQSTPSGDDIRVGNEIHDGPDRTCDTARAGDDEVIRAVGNVQDPILEGYDDWVNINYGGGSGSGGGVVIPSHEEVTYEEALVIRTEWVAILTPDLTVPEDVTVEQETGAGTVVPLTATATDVSDPDVEITSDAPAIFPLGSTTVTFTATNDMGFSTSDSMVVTVVDTTPPDLTVPDDITAEQAGAAGTALTLTATATDICDVAVDVTSDAPAIFPLGDTTVTFTATDDSGNSVSKAVMVHVVDTTAPQITMKVSPDTLWSPNHQMVDITATVTATDVCDAAPTVVLAGIASNEPDDAKGAGDGNTVNDIQADIGAADYDFKVRAERDGNGKGRVYTITYTATDASGNVASASATVTVPHDKK